MNNVIPITAVVAVIIFLIREIMESERRKAADARKKQAFRRLLAEECEKNNWTLKILINTLEHILENNDSDAISLIKKDGEVERISFDNPDEGSGESWLIPHTHSSIFNRLLVEIAGIDEALFDLGCKAYSDLAEASHVRASMLSLISENRNQLLLALAEKYGAERLAAAKTSMASLYKECTGNDLERHKVRSYS